jgi:hypothetical protein
METKSNFKDKKRILARAQNLVGGLEIKHGITIDELKETVSTFIGEEIIFEPATLPSSISGFSVRSKQGPYVVFYDRFRHNEAKNLVITHELAHLLKGDATSLTPCDEREAFKAVVSGNLPSNMLCRSAYSQNPEAEKQVELIATLLLQKVINDDLMQSIEITLTGLKDM